MCHCFRLPSGITLVSRAFNTRKWVMMDALWVRTVLYTQKLSQKKIFKFSFPLFLFFVHVSLLNLVSGVIERKEGGTLNWQAKTLSFFAHSGPLAYTLHTFTNDQNEAWDLLQLFHLKLNWSHFENGVSDVATLCLFVWVIKSMCILALRYNMYLLLHYFNWTGRWRAH